MFSLVVLIFLPTRSNSLMTVLSMPIVGNKVEVLDIFTILGLCLYKSKISLSVLHRNDIFFVSVSSVSKESKPSHSFFSIVPNEKRCIQQSCKQSSYFQQKYTSLCVQNWFTTPLWFLSVKTAINLDPR